MFIPDYLDLYHKIWYNYFMKKKSKYSLTPIPSGESPDKTLYGERESGITHQSFDVELRLCNAVKNGDIDGVNALAEETLSGIILAGELSEKVLMQTKYWCVTVIANAIHYAILGGLDETDAYNLSDSYIRTIDSFDDPDMCIDFLRSRANELVSLVNRSKSVLQVSPGVKRALHYIHIHLHEKISLESLAEEAGLSRDYFCVLFGNEMGITPHRYIINEKLKEAARLLGDGMRPKEVAYTLSFSSQAHFSEWFKAEYGMTPSTFRKTV
ncbi:MAG: AraC family transcriptional regulator [Lachnospiraceae bacterium]|nr:AraC family transcriptional regulator [Lachnospiraceae bacterium]